MWVEQLVFYMFSGLAILSATMVITSRNPVRSALSLVLTFFAVGVLWMLLEAEFLAISLILVYVGAVMVLFLFVVMMLDLNRAIEQEGFTHHFPIAVAIAGLLFVGILYTYGLFDVEVFSLERLPEPPKHSADYSNVAALGKVLFTDYVVAFELAGVILLVAMIAAISLTFRGQRAKKTQVIAHQVAVQAKDRIRLVSLKNDVEQSAESE